MGPDNSIEPKPHRGGFIWTLVAIPWKVWLVLVFFACLVVAGGKIISWVFHTNWVASAIWFLAAEFMIICWRAYKEASLSYFDGESGTFKPRHQKWLRIRLLKLSVVIAIVLAAIGVFVQRYF